MTDVPAPIPRLVIDSGGHKARIQDVLFTPDGRRLISVSNDKTVRIWAVATGELLETLRGRMGKGLEGKLYAGALAPEDTKGRRWLAVGGFLAHGFGIDDDKVGNIRLIDLDSPRDAPLRILKGHDDVIMGLAFSPDGKRLLSGSGDCTVRLWDLESGETIQVLRGHTDAIYAVAFSPNANGEGRIVTGSLDHTLRLWDGAGNPIRVLEGHGAEVFSAAFTPDGNHLLSGSWDKTIRLWDGRTGAFVKRLAEQDSVVVSLSISPDGKKVLTGSGSDPIANHVFAIPSGERLLGFEEHENLVAATAISPDGKLAATGGGNDNEIQLWDLATGRVARKLVGKGNVIWSVGFARDGEAVAWGSFARTDQNPFVFTELQYRFQSREGGESGDAAGSFDPGYAGPVTAEEDYLRALEEVGETRVRTADGQIHATLEILVGDEARHRIERGPTDGGDHRSLTLTPDGTAVISGGGNGVLASYSVASGEKLNDFIGHTGDVWAVAPSPDGRWLVSGSADKTARLWEIASGKLLLTIFPASNGEWVAWTPAGYYTASLDGDRLIGWHIDRGEDRLADYYPAERFAGRFRKPRVVAQYLATGGNLDEAIRLANLELPHREWVERTEIADLPALAPPMVFIAEPFEREMTTDQAVLLLRAEARGVNEAPREMWITVNGRAPGEGGARTFTGNERRVRFETTIALEPGENRIAVYARNRHADSGPEMRIVTRTDAPALEKPDLYLLAIGVSKYKHLKDLHYAHKDAEAVADILQAQDGKLYGRVEIKQVIWSEVSRDNIFDGLEWLKKSTQKDVAVIFIAGHGVRDQNNEYYFMSYDADPERPSRNGVRWSEFRDTLKRLPGTRWLLADTCHSWGITGERRAGLGDSNMTDALRDLGEAAGNIVVMAAATGLEFSKESSEWGHGAFTKAFIEGIAEKRAKHKDEYIRIGELDDYITERVKELTESRQHTVTNVRKLLTETMPNFPVAIVE
uniref:WD40 repeat n=1 Tax=Candidatus Kentrum sp. TC TaxID=2126339 RepID=A0A450YJV0_9GAMM|nr:MAG: WD40 repeat [Candidatus Kentron sp. TC]